MSDEGARAAPFRGTLGYSFPLLAIAVAVYSVLERVVGPGQMDVVLHRQVLELAISSQRQLQIFVSDAFVLSIFALLLGEVMKAASTGLYAYVDQGLSLVIAAICVYSFLFFAGFATATFMYITVAAVVDVVAGSYISRRVERHGRGGPAAQPENGVATLKNFRTP